MGCGGAILNVVTGGISGAVQAAQSGNIGKALTSINTGGMGFGGSEFMPKGDVKKLFEATGDSISTFGGSNIQSTMASGKKHWADISDHLIDPSRVNDKWVRGSGETTGDIFGQDVRKAIGNYVMPIVGGIVTAPTGGWGSAVGAYLGNKFTGGRDRDGAIKALISGASSYAGGAMSGAMNGVTSAMSNSLSSTIGTAAAKAVAQAATKAAISAAMGAATAAAQGKDAGEGALSGAISGAAQGAIETYLNSYAPDMTKMLMKDYGLSEEMAKRLTETALKAGTGAATNAALGKDPITGAIGGAASGITNKLTDSNALNKLMETGITQGSAFAMNPNMFSTPQRQAPTMVRRQIRVPMRRPGQPTQQANAFNPQLSRQTITRPNAMLSPEEQVAFTESERRARLRSAPQNSMQFSNIFG